MQNMDKNRSRLFNAPFKVPTPKAKTNGGLARRYPRSPAVAAEAGVSSNAPRTRKEPDILSDLSQEQGKLLAETRGKRPPEQSPDLHLTSSQKEELHNTVDKQIKKAFRRRIELGSSSKNVPVVKEVLQRSSPRKENQGANLPTTSGAKSPSCSSKGGSYTFKPLKNTSKSPCYQPKLPRHRPKSPHLQQHPSTPNTRSPHPWKSPRTPLTIYSVPAAGRGGTGSTPKSPGGLSVSSSIFPRSPYQANDMSPTIPTHGRLYMMTASVPPTTDTPTTPGRESLLPSGAQSRKRHRSADLESQYEFYLSPQSQRALTKNKKRNQKLKKKAIQEVLAIIDRCRREMELIQARRRDLISNPYYSERGLEPKDPSTPRKPAKPPTIRVVATSATGGVVNQVYDVAQSGSLLQERRGFNENYRQGGTICHPDYLS